MAPACIDSMTRPRVPSAPQEKYYNNYSAATDVHRTPGTPTTHLLTTATPNHTESTGLYNFVPPVSQISSQISQGTQGPEPPPSLVAKGVGTIPGLTSPPRPRCPSQGSCGEQRRRCRLRRRANLYNDLWFQWFFNLGCSDGPGDARRDRSFVSQAFPFPLPPRSSTTPQCHKHEGGGHHTAWRQQHRRVQ